MDGSDAENATLYLRYLDKEMNIMGILSVFCIATVAFPLKELLEAQKSTPLADMWENTKDYVLVGSFLIMFSAACFYRQRSTLAWFYGQICLALSAPQITGINLQDWLADADSWATWVPYRWAFWFLWLGMAGYGAALTSYKCHWIASYGALEFYLGGAVLSLSVNWRISHMLVAHRYEDNPLTLRRFFFGR